MAVLIGIATAIFQHEKVLEKLCNSLVLSEGWSVKFESSVDHIDIWKVGCQNSFVSQPATITTYLYIFEDLTWRLYVHGKVVNIVDCIALVHSCNTQCNIHNGITITGRHTECLRG